MPGPAARGLAYPEKQFPISIRRSRRIILLAGERRRFLLITGLVFLLGCPVPVVKPEAFDQALLQRRPLPADQLSQAADGERIVVPGAQWLSDVKPTDRLTFAGYRPAPGVNQPCLVLALDHAKDRIILLPLPEGRSPLEQFSIMFEERMPLL